MPNIIEKFNLLKGRDRFLILLLFNTLIFTVLALILPLRFEENDDVLMCMIANGTYSGSPDAHLVFINYLYGWILIVFYNVFSGIEWYTVSFCAIHIVSLTTIVFTVLKKADKTVLLNIIFIGLIYYIEIKIIGLFQFTTTAAIAGFAGLLLLFETKKIYKIAGIALFLIGALIRFDAAALIALLMLPVFAYEIFWNKTKMSKLLIPLVICGGTAVLLRFADNRIYNSDSEWAYYKEYNAIRGGINDNYNAGRITDKLPDGISKENFELSARYFFYDIKIFNLQKLKEIDSLLQNISLKDKLKNVKQLLTYKFALSILAFVFIILICIEKPVKKKLWLLFYFGFYISVLCFICLNGSLKYRVLVSTLFVIFFVIYYMAANFTIKKKYRIYAITGLLIIFPIFAYRFITHVNKERIRRNDRREFLINMDRFLTDKLSNKTIILFSIHLTIEFWNPFDIKNFLIQNKIITSGWLSAIPFNKGYWDSYLSLLDNNTYFFMSQKDKHLVPEIQKVIFENYNIETETDIISDNGCFLIKFKQKH